MKGAELEQYIGYRQQHLKEHVEKERKCLIRVKYKWAPWQRNKPLIRDKTGGTILLLQQPVHSRDLPWAGVPRRGAKAKLALKASFAEPLAGEERKNEEKKEKECCRRQDIGTEGTGSLISIMQTFAELPFCLSHLTISKADS